MREGGVNDALRALVRRDPEVHRQVRRHVDPLVAQGVEALGVLAKEDPVHVLARDAHRAHVGEQVQFLAHQDVGTLQVGPAVSFLRSVCGAFQDDVALLDRLQNVVGDGLHLGRSVLDGEPLDDSELHFPGRYLVSKQVIENSLRLRTDRRTDAVAPNHAYDDRADRGVVDPVDFLFQYGSKHVTAASIRHLRHVEALTNLRVGNFTISDVELAELKHLTPLKRLRISAARISDEGLAFLPELKELESLDISHNGTRLTNNCLHHVRKLSGLRELVLHNNVRINDVGLERLQELTKLRKLNLNGTRITDSGLAHLENMIHLTDLQLGGTRITDAGLVHLRELKYLRMLNRSGTPITNAGLADLKRLQTLGRLMLDYTKVTPAGVNGLKKALPDATITAKGQYRGKE